MSSKIVHKWYAEWCSPCKSLEPKLAKVAGDLGIEVIPMDVEEHGELAQELNIRSVPSLVMYRGEDRLASRNGVGNITEENLREMFTTVYGEEDAAS